MKRLGCVVLLLVMCAAGVAAQGHSIQIERIGRYAGGIFNPDAGAAEISAFDPKSMRLFTVNANDSTIDVLNISNPAAPTKLFSIDVTPYGDQANSVAFHHGVLAAAIQAPVKTDPGVVVFFDADGNFISQVTVGALPDMITFTPDGRKVLVANEGEPSDDYTVDPEGTVSIIDLKHGAARVTQADVINAGFGHLNPALFDASIRIYGPNATPAQDFEPEYIAVSHDSKTAWVTLQENNAIGVLDLVQGVFTEVRGLGFKDHSLAVNALDPSDRDGGINIAPWPVYGMFQPDAIASFRHLGQTYLITANEGDARDYAGFTEESRISALTLDPAVFPNAAFLQNNARLGRLTVTTATGDPDNDGDFDALYVLGARSFTIWTAGGTLVYDSGDQLEQITAQAHPTNFNPNNDANGSFDTRCDNKGPEPEAVAVGEVFGRTFAFVGLERIGGIAVFEISNPAAPAFVQYLNPRNFAGDPADGTADDLGPEGMLYIPGHESPIQEPLLVVSNEISGSVSVYKISKAK